MVSESSQTRTLTGGCMCGAVRYEVRDFPAGEDDGIDGVLCHCKTCQKMNTMLSYNVQGVRQNLHVVTGEPKTWVDDNADSGKPITRAFCGTCGTALWSAPDSAPEVVFVKAGALDQIDEVKPKVEIVSSGINNEHIAES
ncbi:hypothetical protein QFC20_004852 [Naganishia adeliensis]|uniref:Uncharacterized protein n=1 Tax=Naganishia adeliensis TaxID=92952 RepID=A0ACC2VUF8_9TREE|nr:hypothetical protein QFC20_004852 [Naganishia adeliensis]